MSITIRAYANADDVYVVWKAPKINDCVGFALERKLIHKTGQASTGYVENRTGFEDDRSVKPGEHRPSDQWPFQRHWWTDHSVNTGDRVKYRVIPAFENADKTIRLDQASASDWTQEATLGPDAGDMACYFNRGFIMSQFVRRGVNGDLSKKNLTSFKNSLSSVESNMRKFLYGDLGREILQLLDNAKRTRQHVYAALYELADPELIGKLIALGQRAHVVLANGSSKKKGQDENEEARKQLQEAGVDVHDRMLWSKGLGHNKFIVFCHTETDARQVWTGSMNWMTSALCTQINNGLLINNRDIANQYLEQWTRLKDAGNDFPKDLVSANSEAKKGDGWTLWFTRTSAGQDLDFCKRLIDQAKSSILFLMFEPGPQGLQNEILARKGEIYVHGVINTLNQNKSKSKNVQNTNVELIRAGDHRHFNLDIVQPEGVKRDDLKWWGQEVTRRLFLTSQHGAFGFAIIHSKVIVIDPFGDDPIVMTGSHNLGASAAKKNDENLMIVRGNKELAQKYAVHIASVYDHFRWRAYLLQEDNPYQGLKHDDTWQDISGSKLRDIDFWLGTKRLGVAA